MVELLRAVEAPPRLGAHLRAVHDVAIEILDRLGDGVGVDREAVLFGVATHDIGKVRFPGELSGAGAEHETAVKDRLARFAAAHGRCDGADATVEELLADKVWKGRREAGLEQKVAEVVAAAIGEPVWAAFMRLDDELARIADGADDRLAFQARFSLETDKTEIADEIDTTASVDRTTGADGTALTVETNRVETD
ncbi:HD domain-containing protein [Dactylosporangium sp. NPDC051484]|uniref:HD domain-containing protein n=1 Tax=Dactylosporangium sp. NPDC051484 TaxID=3154942 RepID=UPI00344B54D1